MAKLFMLGEHGKSSVSEWRRANPEKALESHLKSQAIQRDKRLKAGNCTANQTKCVECGLCFLPRGR